jgi:hypothetical protein
MQLRVFAILGLLLVAPFAAQANTIVFQGGGSVVELPANSVGQTVTLVMSGGDSYSDGNLLTTIAAGGPAISAVFGDNLTAIPVGNLASSVWVNGFAGIAQAPNGTTFDSSGRELQISFATAGLGSINTQGIVMQFTVDTFSPGDYLFDLNNGSFFANGLDEFGDPVFVNMDFVPLTLRVVPEPSSIVMGLMAAAGMAAVVIRRRRTA